MNAYFVSLIVTVVILPINSPLRENCSRRPFFPSRKSTFHLVQIIINASKNATILCKRHKNCKYGFRNTMSLKCVLYFSHVFLWLERAECQLGSKIVFWLSSICTPLQKIYCSSHTLLHARDICPVAVYKWIRNTTEPSTSWRHWEKVSHTVSDHIFGILISPIERRSTSNDLSSRGISEVSWEMYSSCTAAGLLKLLHPNCDLVVSDIIFIFIVLVGSKKYGFSVHKGIAHFVQLTI